MPRLGISFLSKDNVDVAYIQEVMCNKRTGEFLVKTDNTDTVSYQYFTRLRQNEAKTEKAARDYGLISTSTKSVDIYNLPVDSWQDETAGGAIQRVVKRIPLPETITEDTEYINEGCWLGGKISKFIVSVDLDSIVIRGTCISCEVSDNIKINMTVEARLYDDTVLETKTISENVNNCHTQLFSFSETTIESIEKIVITSITFSNDPNVEMVLPYRLILNSIMLAVETEIEGNDG